MEKYAIKNYNRMSPVFSPFSQNISTFLASISQKWMDEARLSVHAYEKGCDLLDKQHKNLPPAYLTSLYGEYLKDTIETI